MTEAILSDVTAIGVLVSLPCSSPGRGVGASEAIQRFASTATITILAMYILSEAIQQTGIVERLGVTLARITRGAGCDQLYR